MDPIIYTFKNSKIPIKITYRDAIEVLPEKFDIRLTKMFADNEACVETMHNLILDDEKTLKLLWHYAEKSCGVLWDDLLDMSSSKFLDEFREAFWSAVVNFSGPLRKNLLLTMWDEFKKDIKNPKLQREMSGELPIDSAAEE